MGMFSGIMKAIAPLALTVLTGGAAAPLMAMAMKMVAMEVAKQVIQIVGEKLGLPQGIIDMCKMACASAAGMPDSARTSLREGIGNLAREANLSPSDSGAFQRDMQSAANSSFEDMQSSIQSFVDNVNLGNANKKTRGDINSVMNGKGSMLMKLAVALGQIADQKMNGMASKAEEIGGMGEIKGKNQAKFTQMNAELSALGQEFGVISQAMNSVIKSLGEGASTIARKS